MHKGHAFRLVGLILGIVGTATSITAIVFSTVGLMLAKKTQKPHIHR